MPVTVKREDVSLPPILEVSVRRDEGFYSLSARHSCDGIWLHIDGKQHDPFREVFTSLDDFKIFSAAVIEMMEQ